MGALVQVRGGLPGERVRLRIEHTGQDGTHYGQVQDVLRASPHRVASPCEHFLRCGGCDLLHADLSFQRAVKRAHVAEALGLALEEVRPTLASPRGQGYRSLAKMVVGPDGILGSYRPRSHDVQDMRGCIVHAPEAEAVVQAVRAFTATVPLHLRYLIVRALIAAGRCVVTLVVRSAGAEGIGALAEALSQRPDVARVVRHINDAPGDALIDPDGAMLTLFDEGPLREQVGPVQQDLQAGAFAQVNPLAAAELYRVACEGAEPEGARVLDLYAGSGGVGLALLHAGATSVLAVESVPAATQASLAAAAAQGLSAQYEAKTGAAQVVLQGLKAQDYDVAMLNPPRKGAGPAVMQQVLRMAPRRLVYISCNPKTLARDVADLRHAGYTLGPVTPVDLFPHTRHVETVLVAHRHTD